jgi:hypothetical protein
MLRSSTTALTLIMTIMDGKLVKAENNLVSLCVIRKCWIKFVTVDDNHLRADANQLPYISYRCLCNSTTLVIMNEERKGERMSG